mmetsp:Transcript_66677/g.144814  ORF Transcript_66677/g.144814 Transcript_66677/m.144814 type:complete len:797 (-) Transcript_66677:829-3219(-)
MLILMLEACCCCCGCGCQAVVAAAVVAVVAAVAAAGVVADAAVAVAAVIVVVGAAAVAAAEEKVWVAAVATMVAKAERSVVTHDSSVVEKRLFANYEQEGTYVTCGDERPASAAAAAAAAGAGGPAYRAPVENPLDADNLRQLQEAAGGIRFGQVLKFIVGLIALSSCLMALDIVDVSQMQEYSAELLTKEGLLKLGTSIKEELSSLVGIASKASTAVSPGMGDLMKDEDEAKELFKIAALNGHWGAAFALAMIELDGPDRSTAIPWLKMVAEHGDESSRAFCLHFMHRWGLGKEKDARLAGKYLVEAAEKGDANAVLLLAEANSQEFSEDSEVIPPGGPNHTQALIHFRSAASKGRSTGRFNIGVLLTRVHPMHKMNSAQCRETKAEFVEVATDLEPNLRLLFALALRSFEFGESESALGLFMFLSELGSNKAHRNAAQLWENLILPGAQAVELATEQVQPPSLAAPGQPKTLPAASTGSESVEVDEAALPKVMSDSDGKTSELEVNHSDADPDIVADFGKETDTDTSSRVTPKQVDKEEPAQAAPAPPPPSKGQPTPLTIPITLGMSEDGRPLVGSFEEKMAGRFCCSKFACQEASSAPSDTCGCDWLVNEWLSDPVDCLQRCASDQRCRYATIYGSGFCQLSEECGSAVQAGDSSAQTFELKRPQELQPEPTGFQWCWPPTPETQTRENARRCAASFFCASRSHGWQWRARSSSLWKRGGKSAKEIGRSCSCRHETSSPPRTTRRGTRLGLSGCGALRQRARPTAVPQPGGPGLGRPCEEHVWCSAGPLDSGG